MSRIGHKPIPVPSGVKVALQDGKISVAYRLASRHGMTDGQNFAEAEFLAGWIELRYLRDVKQAYDHFVRLFNDASRPISMARGA